MFLSQAEENYLKTIFKLSSSNGQPVSTNAIAAALHTAAASVTDMLKRLSEKQLISYEKYKGVQLTDAGSKAATSLVRKHRLWETFLTEKLHFPWDEVHDLAEQLEHIQSDVLTSRLDQFLGHPRFDPHGGPIPDAAGRWELPEQTALSELNPGIQGRLARVADDSPVFLQHLNQLGLALGAKIEVMELFPFDHSLKIRANGAPVMLSEKVAQNLMISLHD